MTVKELKKVLEKFDDDTEICVGCQGYTNRCESYDMFIYEETDEQENLILITDACNYSPIGDGILAEIYWSSH